MLKLALGEDIFEKFRKNSEIYIDKSLFIKDVIENTNQVLLITRPRRFGKTLNMTMLKAFFEIKNEEIKKEYEGYFKDLKIWSYGDKYVSHFCRYPIIFMTLKGGSSDNWEDCFDWLKLKIIHVFKEHRVIIDSLNDDEKKYYNDILYKRGTKSDFSNAIGELLRWLQRYYKEMPILLIDEYDAPLNDGFNNGFENEIVNFMRNMFSYAMKTNPALHKAIITGLTKIAGKSLFSTLNHFMSYNVLENEFSEYFGFTESEVRYAIEKSGTKHTMEEISRWYNGYNFGGNTPIYNPWSIMNVCNSPHKFLTTYWTFTASEDSLGVVINNASITAKEKMYELLNGNFVELPIHDDVTYETLNRNWDVLWTFLLYAGYLTTVKISRKTATFRIPNFEVKEAFQETMSRWITEPIYGTEDVNIMIIAMLKGKKETFLNKLSIFIFNSFSYFDVTKYGNEPERVYHAFILGLLCHIQETYYVSSNPEAGEGRADIMIMPKTGELMNNAVVLEFKKTDKKEDLDKVAKDALIQIKSKKYISEALKRGAREIYAYGIGFFGRDVGVIMEKISIN